MMVNESLLLTEEDGKKGPALGRCNYPSPADVREKNAWPALLQHSRSIKNLNNASAGPDALLSPRSNAR